MSDPNLPTKPPMPTLPAYHPAASNARQSTDDPQPPRQAPRTRPTSADPWTPPVGVVIPKGSQSAPQSPPPGLNRPIPTRTQPKPTPTPGPRPTPFKPTKK